MTRIERMNEIFGPELAEKIRERVLSSDFIETFPQNLTLADAFIWEETPEGYDFWAEVEKQFHEVRF